jgi:hypothetical protein
MILAQRMPIKYKNAAQQSKEIDIIEAINQSDSKISIAKKEAIVSNLMKNEKAKEAFLLLPSEKKNAFLSLSPEKQNAFLSLTPDKQDIFLQLSKKQQNDFLKQSPEEQNQLADKENKFKQKIKDIHSLINKSNILTKLGQTASSEKEFDQNPGQYDQLDAQAIVNNFEKNALKKYFASTDPKNWPDKINVNSMTPKEKEQYTNALDDFRTKAQKFWTKQYKNNNRNYNEELKNFAKPRNQITKNSFEVKNSQTEKDRLDQENQDHFHDKQFKDNPSYINDFLKFK